MAYLNRITLLLAYVSYRGSIEVAANRPVPWQEGPARAELPPAERPPNIVFILFDDLGINDLSTLRRRGCGWAGADAPYRPARSRGCDLHSGLCRQCHMLAVARAVLMTGRYASRTGFEYTPTPAGHAAARGDDVARAPA